MDGQPERRHKIAMIKQHMAPRVEGIVVLVLVLIALAHLLRLVTGIEVVIAGMELPLWVSLFGFLGPAVLAGLFWWSRH